jgi:hypothetical protein
MVDTHTTLFSRLYKNTYASSPKALDDEKQKEREGRDTHYKCLYLVLVFAKEVVSVTLIWT